MVLLSKHGIVVLFVENLKKGNGRKSTNLWIGLRRLLSQTCSKRWYSDLMRCINLRFNRLNFYGTIQDEQLVMLIEGVLF